MDSYCVQEDWPTKTARVHRDDYRYSNNARLPAWSYRAEQRLVRPVRGTGADQGRVHMPDVRW